MTWHAEVVPDSTSAQCLAAAFDLSTICHVLSCGLSSLQHEILDADQDNPSLDWHTANNLCCIDYKAMRLYFSPAHMAVTF
jgi:hypothetical protein